MVMWIVLGSLVGVVVIFLAVTSTLDRKKSKKLKIEKETLAKEINAAAPSVAKKIVAVIKTNDKEIKNFVPSVGKVKMSDINKKAKDKLKDIKHSKDFKLLKHDEETFTEFSNNIEGLIAIKSNNWVKRAPAEIKFFKEYKPAEKVVETKKGKRTKKVAPVKPAKATKKAPANDKKAKKGKK